jgi:hypothetical protein
MMLYSLLCMCTGLYVAAWEKKRELEEEVSLLQTGMHMHQFIYYKLLHTRGVRRHLASHFKRLKDRKGIERHTSPYRHKTMDVMP